MKQRGTRIETRRGPPCGWWQGRRLLYRAAIGIALAVAFPADGSVVRAQGNTSSEYQVKAAFLFHFAQFVDWPAETFKDASSPITYCTLGDDPFRGALEATLSGKSIGARPLRVQHFKQAQEARGCQVLFIGTADKKFISDSLANVNGDPILTVGEAEHFAQVGGVIGFTLSENKVRFEINLDAAEHAGLKISSKLLVLAKTVIGGPKGN